MKKKKYLKTLFQSLCGQHRTDCFNFIQIHGKIFTWSKYLHGEFNIKILFIRATEQGALSSIGKEVDENKHRYKLYRISCSVKLPSKRKTNIQEELEKKKAKPPVDPSLGAIIQLPESQGRDNGLNCCSGNTM